MFKFVVKKFCVLCLVLFVISTIIFFLQRMIPGSPADIVLGVDAPETEKQLWLVQYGFSKPLWEQYAIFIWNLMHFNFGNSFVYQKPIFDLILPRLYQTVILAVLAFGISLFVSLLIGILSALHEEKWPDRLCAFLSLFFVSAPTFVTGPILIWIFCVKLNVLPIAQTQSPLSYILPSVTLGLSMAAYSGRMIRSGIIVTLKEDYMRTALSKGLSFFRATIHHGLKNALLPAVTIFGMQLAVLLSGTIITEYIFNWPGIGSLIVQAITERDYNLVSGCVIVMASIYVVCNFTVDLISKYLDPRIRLS